MEPAFFGVRPHVVLKAGVIAWATMGDANALDPDPAAAAAAADVRRVRRHAGPARRALRRARGAGGRSGRTLGQRPAAGPGQGRVRLSKADLPENDALPAIDVDPETFAVRVDGELIEPEPAAELPMAQRYFLF